MLPVQFQSFFYHSGISRVETANEGRRSLCGFFQSPGNRDGKGRIIIPEVVVERFLNVAFVWDVYDSVMPDGVFRALYQSGYGGLEYIFVNPVGRRFSFHFRP